MLSLRLSVGSFCLLLVACGGTPGAQPHDMSASEHEASAQQHQQLSEAHARQYEPEATREQTHCTAAPRSPSGVPLETCWTSVRNPTEEHRRAAEEHRRHAADHRAASETLREAEARACVGVHPNDRDTSPFMHTEDILKVEPLMERAAPTRSPSGRGTGGAAPEHIAGAIVTFRAVPGLTAESLQGILDCHIARNAAFGHERPDMPNCPLVPRGVTAQVSQVPDGFAVSIRAADRSAARDVLARAQHLAPQSSSPSGSGTTE